MEKNIKKVGERLIKKAALVGRAIVIICNKIMDSRMGETTS